MINKFIVPRSKNVKYVQDHLDQLVGNALFLSRYTDDNPLKSIAEENFRRGFEYILEEREVENDYECMLQLHDILMDGLNQDIRGVISRLWQQLNSRRSCRVVAAWTSTRRWW